MDQERMHQQEQGQQEQSLSSHAQPQQTEVPSSQTQPQQTEVPSSQAQPQGDVFAQIIDATRDAFDGAADAYRETFQDFQAMLPSFDDIVAQAVRLPGTGVNRASYLSEALGRKHARALPAAIDTTPRQAGLSPREIEKIAKKSLAKDGRRTTMFSLAAGIPGGAAAAATVTADLIQFHGYLIRAAQKLTYLYGWRDLIHIEAGSGPDTATAAALVVCLGVMADSERARASLARLARLRATGASDQALRAALAARAMQDEVDEVAQALTANLARRLGGHVVDKAIPVVGGIVSGFVTHGDFGEMCNALHAQLKLHGA